MNVSYEDAIDLFTDTAAILNSIVLTERGQSLENLSYTQLSG